MTFFSFSLPDPGFAYYRVFVQLPDLFACLTTTTAFSFVFLLKNDLPLTVPVTAILAVYCDSNLFISLLVRCVDIEITSVV